jgi:hypothetical protein
MSLSSLKEFALALLAVVLVALIAMLPVLLGVMLFGDSGGGFLPRLGALTFW